MECKVAINDQYLSITMQMNCLCFHHVEVITCNECDNLSRSFILKNHVVNMQKRNLACKRKTRVRFSYPGKYYDSKINVG